MNGEKTPLEQMIERLANIRNKQETARKKINRVNEWLESMAAVESRATKQAAKEEQDGDH